MSGPDRPERQLSSRPAVGCGSRFTPVKSWLYPIARVRYRPPKVALHSMMSRGGELGIEAHGNLQAMHRNCWVLRRIVIGFIEGEWRASTIVCVSSTRSG